MRTLQLEWPVKHRNRHVRLNCKRKSGECRIVFGIRTRERVTESLRASSDTFSVETSGNPHLSECPSAGQKPPSIKNWLLFGSMLPNASPLAEGSFLGNSTSLELKAYVPPSVMGKIFIPENDEIFYLRAFKCRVKRFYGADGAGNADYAPPYPGSYQLGIRPGHLGGRTFYLYRTDFLVQPDAKVACWYGEKEGHMKRPSSGCGRHIRA